MKMITFTNIYPNPAQPNRGVFIAQMLQKLDRKITNYVISPLPWSPNFPILRKEWSAFTKVPFTIDDTTYYPKYFLVPKISGAFNAISIAARCYPFIKKFIKTQNIELINGHWIYPDCVAAVWIAKKLSLPVVISARGCDINLYKNFRFRRPQIKWALENADAITTVTKSLQNAIVDEFGIEKRKITVIKNGINMGLFNKLNKPEARSKLGLQHNRKYLLFVGSLDEVKGVIYLINALKILKSRGKLKFFTKIIGDGPDKAFLEEQVKQFRLQKYVDFLGVKPHNEISVWMKASDILCLPSKREGMPNVILEAQACGLPVVASNVGGIPEIVDNSNGILVSPQNTEALANALTRAFLTYRNHIDVAVVYSWKDCAEKYSELYYSVLNKRC